MSRSTILTNFRSRRLDILVASSRETIVTVSLTLISVILGLTLGFLVPSINFFWESSFFEKFDEYRTTEDLQLLTQTFLIVWFSRKLPNLFIFVSIFNLSNVLRFNRLSKCQKSVKRGNIRIQKFYFFICKV